MRFHTNRNDRSWHTTNRRTVDTLKRHAELMAKYVEAGMTKDEASKKAYDVVTGKAKE